MTKVFKTSHASKLEGWLEEIALIIESFKTCSTNRVTKTIIFEAICKIFMLGAVKMVYNLLIYLSTQMLAKLDPLFGFHCYIDLVERTLRRVDSFVEKLSCLE